MNNILKILINEHNSFAKIVSKINILELKKIEKISKILIKKINHSKNIFIIGNGGSAAQSQHFSAELLIKYKKVRKPISAISLTTDTSAITACANDFEFKFIFSRQLEALGKRGDVLIAFSTSGKSKNIIEAIKTAQKKKIFTLLFTGNNRFNHNFKDIYSINCPSTEVPRIQEIHMFYIHLICEVLDKEIR
jgi:D-sedoheptulose 7-phosphate isomerase